MKKLHLNTNLSELISRFLKSLVLVLFFTSVSSSVAASFFEDISLYPYPFSASTGVSVEVVFPPGQADNRLEYRWFVNGEERFFEKNEHFPGDQIERGDTVVVEVVAIPYEGDRSIPFISQPFEADNAPPVITSEPPQELTETGFSYQVTATDPDGDSLTFRFETAPEGMSIDPTTGLIQWRFVTMPEGSFPVIIVVEDGFGGGAQQQFQLQLAFE